MQIIINVVNDTSTCFTPSVLYHVITGVASSSWSVRCTARRV